MQGRGADLCRQHAHVGRTESDNVQHTGVHGHVSRVHGQRRGGKRTGISVHNVSSSGPPTAGIQDMGGRVFRHARCRYTAACLPRRAQSVRSLFPRVRRGFSVPD